MKKTIILITLLSLTVIGVQAKTSLASHLRHANNLQLRTAQIDAAPAPIYTVSGLHQTGNTATFADLDANKTSMPISPAMSLGLLVLVILARVFGVTRARGLADSEKEIYRGKAGMFRALQGRA